MKLLLQHKALLGYILLMAVIGCMIAIMFHERIRIREIETATSKTNQMWCDIHTTYRYITVLATCGESVITWKENDYQNYHSHRLCADSLLQGLKVNYGKFIQPERIDTLQYLLKYKEMHLLQIMQVFHQKSEVDSLLMSRLSIMDKQAASPQVITKKRKGIAGWFGKKETIQVQPSSRTLQPLNKQLINMYGEQAHDLSVYADSLRSRNQELNQKLSELIFVMDRQVQTAFQNKEKDLKASYNYSTALVTGLVIFSIIMLVFSYLMIQRDVKHKLDSKRQKEKLIGKLEKTVKRNEELIVAYRRIMQSVSHDLRSPLSAICGNLELIEQDSDDSERERHIQAVRQSAGRMTSLLADLLNYYRLDSGKEQIIPKPFHLRDIANILEAEFSSQIKSKQLVFHVENCNDEVVIGDKEQILRIGSNLLSNAIKFTEQGAVSLHTAYTKGVFTIKVKDTGSGIEEARQSEIFKPFERLTNAATQEGFGLGLSITLALVKLLGGQIEVHSILAKGSTFTVKLPLSLCIEEDAILDNEKQTLLPSGLRVAVVDNDTILLTMTVEMLSRSKVLVDGFRNARELLERMRTQQYDLILTDIVMPEMSGFGLLELLRSSNLNKAKTIPVVAMTARAEDSEEVFNRNGFAGCLYKPFSRKELMAMVLHSIRGRKSEQAIVADFSILLTDEENKKEMLELLAQETKKDMEVLADASKCRDIEVLSNFLHHLSPLWEAMRINDALLELRNALSKGSPSDEMLNKIIDKIRITGKRLIEQIERSIKEEANE